MRDQVFARRFDPQVNGAGGVSYTDEGLNLEKANAIADAYAADQLATLITTSKERFLTNIAVVADMCDQREDVRGIHLEGPFISPKAAGAHPKQFVLDPSIEIMRELLEAGRGHVSLVTVDPSGPRAHDLIKYLVDEGVTVSIGHTSSSKAQFWAGIEAGATALTHVPNAWDKNSDARQEKEIFVPELASDPRVYPMMIADRRHTSVAFVQHVWAKAVGLEDRFVLVSDASPLFNLPAGNYDTFDGLQVRVCGPNEVVPEREDVPRDGYPMTWPLSGSMHSLEDCLDSFAVDTGVRDPEVLGKVGGRNAFEMLRVPLLRSGKFPEELK
ncbi:MAG: hypothetical protein KDD70_03590 [Bdellovibrionales bacterium]|nr:hypothetical protein [Bdellovibrionales bacterium]